MNRPGICFVIAAAFAFATPFPAAADITNFEDNWTLVQSPGPDPSFTANATGTVATLSAGATAVTAGTGIGYTSIDGNTAATSTSGYVFDINADFTIGIDYSVTLQAGSSGSLAFVFGVGESRTAADAAGVLFLTDNTGVPFFFPTYQGVASIGGVQQPLGDTGLNAELSGSLFVEYTESTGDITLSATNVNGTGSVTFNGLQNNWNDAPLLASFLMRSEDANPFSPGWEGGDGSAVFSNFRIIDGSARFIPEPGSFMLTGFATLLLLTRRRTR